MVSAGAKTDAAAIQQALRCGASGCRCLANSNPRFHCPAHAGEGASLSVTEKDGKILVHCFSGCDGDAVVSALKEQNLWPTAEAKADRNVQVAEYDYLSVAGNLVFQVVKFDNPKSFKQRQPDGKGGYLWHLKDVTRIPYQAPELTNADLNAVVFITEGEKDVDRLRDLGLVATCNPGGAGKWLKPYSENYLRDRNVVILPDNDGPGRDHAEKVAKFTNPVAASVRVVELPGLPDRGDVSNWIDAGHTVEELLALVEAAPPWQPRDPEPAEMPETDSDYRATDVGNGRRFIAAHLGDVRYCWQWGCWLVWNGKHWERDTTGELPRRAKGVIDALFPEAEALFAKASVAAAAGEHEKASKLLTESQRLFKHAQRSEGAARIAALLDMARSEPGVPVRPQDLDSDPWSLNCGNGTISLKTGLLRPHRRADLLTMICPVDYEPDARLDLWDRFLTEAIPDEETREYTQRYAGATAAGLAINDLLIVLHGPGGSAKSTFLNSLQAALGEYAAAADLATFTNKKDPHAPAPDLARLQGKRMVAVSEPGPGDTMSLLKRASGGDPITTRSHHQETFEYIPQFTIWIVTNERPRVPHDDSGIWRRLREIPFLSKFAKVDTSIRTRLTDPNISGTAILSWIVQGCLNWQRDGVGELPKQILNATKEYRDEMDPLADWIEDRVEIEVNHWVPFIELWTDYQGWAKENGIRRPLGRKTFSQHLGEKFSPIKGSGGVRGNNNLALKRGDSGISQMPLTPDPEGLSEISPYTEEKPPTKCHEMPLQAQTERGDEMPLTINPNATNSDEMPLCAGCSRSAPMGYQMPDGTVWHNACMEMNT